jgi:phosphoribosylaminoimidazole-succinocarboxamide synthase
MLTLQQGIPAKGALLTQLSAHWFNLIATWMPSLKTHFLSAHLPSSIPSEARSGLDKRSMQVRRYKIVPLESIVRGYITGSAWSEYKKHGTVHGMPMPSGLQESQKLEKPIWTPSTKAEQGEHDENISRDKAVDIVGESVAKRVEEASLLIYEKVGLLSRYRTGLGCIDSTFPGEAIRRRARHHHRRYQIRVWPRRGGRDRARRRSPHAR